MLPNYTTRDKTRVTIHTEGDERRAVEGGRRSDFVSTSSAMNFPDQDPVTLILTEHTQSKQWRTPVVSHWPHPSQ